MSHFDLCLPWYWEFDFDFVRHVEHACFSSGITFWEVNPENLLEATSAVYLGERTFGALIDRSQDNRRFEPLLRWAGDHDVRRINRSEQSIWAEDKATMHLELINGGIYTPHTIIIPSFLDNPLLPEIDLSPLGDQFVIKPSHGGGGEGVVLGASSLEHIRRVRMEYPEQKYLIQAYVTPRWIDERPAWFRVFFAGGEVIPTWWHPSTHVYTPLSSGETEGSQLQPLWDIGICIAAICKLDWFSTEIAWTDQEFVVVDYVNDQIDLRAQTKSVDGVPDEVIRRIAERLVALAVERT